ncbi:hypothetical protein [Bradyrhizobium sp. CCGB20]|uniref:hypothetical protein n=1 Tax=Bradyrhizobium sp. CCGB20 TaxID=2949633 RepID=UPI0020B25D52|nr:hypothetical protein [Bradyrhizobium sp. CCGB20]MCP3400185.1 hypothetical protein [Bradyrhizobium sp. CCGB20]
MSDFNLNASARIDSSTPFCAEAYFTALRAEGRDPVVRQGALHVLLKGSSKEDSLGKWAAHHDPQGKMQIEHARAAWAARTSEDEIIVLGVRQ